MVLVDRDIGKDRIIERGREKRERKRLREREKGEGRVGERQTP